MKKQDIKTAIIGPGAMGQLLASHLYGVCPSLLLIDHNVQRAETFNKKGIKIIRDGEDTPSVFMTEVSACPEEAGIMDWIVIFVKSYKTEEILHTVKAMSGGNTMILSLQNGIGQEEILKREVPAERIVLGITAHGAAIYKDCVKHSGKGMTFIGPLEHENEKTFNLCAEFAEILNKAGWETRAVRDIAPYRWKKLIANCAINALTAITGVKNGELARDEELRHIMLLAAEEAWHTARASGIDVDTSLDETLDFVKDICIRTAENRSSMLQDVTAGRRTEIDYINKTVTVKARENGVNVPVNETLTAIIKKREFKRKK